MNLVSKVTQQIIELLDAGTIPWKKNWLVGSYSHSTGKIYTGINRLLLPAGEWATWNMIQKEGGHVIKGSKASYAVFCKPEEVVDGKIVSPFMYRGFSLYEVNTQTEGITPIRTTNVFEQNMSAESILANYLHKPKIEWEGRAVYYIKINRIGIPMPEQFFSTDAYYAALFHELVHSTGDHLGRFDKFERGAYEEAYSREELIAELGASMLCNLCGIESQIENAASYIANWKRFIANDERAILTAASKAEAAVNFILNKAKNSTEEEE